MAPLGMRSSTLLDGVVLSLLSNLFTVVTNAGTRRRRNAGTDPQPRDLAANDAKR